MNEFIKPNIHICEIMTEYVEELEFKYKNPEKLCGLSTGYDCLDNALNGLKSGEVTIIGGRFGIGKTAFAINLTYNIATDFYIKHQQNPDDDKCVVYIDLQLTPKLFASKLLSLHSAIPLYKLHKAEDLEENFDKICETEHAFRKLPIYYLSNIIGINSLEKELQKIEKQVGCIIIDYLQLLSEDYYQYPSREDFSLIVLQIKSLARKLGVPIIVLAQVKRDVEYRSNKRPLRWDICGYEHNHHLTNNILFLYREHYYNLFNAPRKDKKETEDHYQERVRQWQKEREETQDLCEIIVAQNTGGSCGIIKMHFDCLTGLFWEDKEK